MRRVRAFSVSARELVRNREVDDWEQHLAEVRLVRLIQQPSTDLVPLDGPDATSTGCLLAVTGPATSSIAHLVICARRAGQAVVTSDPDDLSRLDRVLPLVVV